MKNIERFSKRLLESILSGILSTAGLIISILVLWIIGDSIWNLITWEWNWHVFQFLLSPPDNMTTKIIRFVFIFIFIIEIFSHYENNSK